MPVSQFDPYAAFALLAGVLWLIIVIIVIALVLAIFAIRRAAEKTARATVQQNSELATLNTQLAWLNNYLLNQSAKR